MLQIGLTLPLVAYLGFSLVMAAEIAAARVLVFEGSSVMPAFLAELLFALALLGLVDLLLPRKRAAAFSVTLAALSLFLFAFSLNGRGSSATLSGHWQPIYLGFLIGAAPLSLLPLLRRNRLRLAVDGPDRAVRIGGCVALAAMVILSTPLLRAPARASAAHAVRERGLFAYSASRVATAPSAPAASDASPAGGVKWSPQAVAAVDPTDTTAVGALVDAALKRSKSTRIADFPVGAYRGANVIVVQVESMQAFVLGLAVGEQWITPQLNRLASESWTFQAAFSETGPGNTSDAEWIMNTSLYAPLDRLAAVDYAGKQVPALPRLLASSGYETFSMHANTSRFWNRKNLYPALGFQHYYDSAFFGVEDTVGMGMSDGLMLKKAAPVLIERAGAGPIYAQIVTITPHHPFVLPARKQRLTLPEWLEGSTVGNYLQVMNYEDRALGYLIARLKQSGLWDNSIFVVYGDHYGLRASDLGLTPNGGRFNLLIGHPYNPVDRCNIPLIIHLPKQDKGIAVARPIGQVDIMPTLADALGLDLSSVPHFGRSGFVQSRVLFPAEDLLPATSFVNGRLICVGGPTFDKSEGLSIASPGATELEPAEEADFDDMQTLRQLCSAYAAALPERPDAQPPTDAIIPGGAAKFLR